MKLPLAAGVWAFVCLAGAFAGMWRGYGGPPFAVALAAFAALFAVQVGFAAEGVTGRLGAWLDSVRGMLPLIRATAPKELNVKMDFDQSVFVRGAVTGVVREAVLASLLVSFTDTNEFPLEITSPIDLRPK